MELHEITIMSAHFFTAEAIVIILHGYGNSGADYVTAIDRFWRKGIDNAIFIMPDAPSSCDTWTGKQWFPLTLEKMTYEEIRKGLDEIAPTMRRYITKKAAEYGCKNIYLVGISQGAITALEMIYYSNISGIISYSGLFAKPIEGTILSTPDVLLVHSENDNIVPYTCAQKAEKELKELGIDVKLKTLHDAGHYVSQEGWEHGCETLKHWTNNRG